MARKKPPSTKKAKRIVDQAVALAEYGAKALVAAEQLRIKTKVVEHCPLVSVHSGGSREGAQVDIHGAG